MTDNRSVSREHESREWFEEWFSHPMYLKVYLHRDTREAETCVNTILRITEFPAVQGSTSLLDIACGAGRHALAFARAGLQVTANDLSRYLLGIARDAARQENLPIVFTESDMRHIRQGRTFDLVVQLFSSFGYFDTEEEDRSVLRNVANMLEPGGWYVLDLINPAHLHAHFTPRSKKNVDNLSILEERTISANRVRKTITIEETGGKSFTFIESVRLYEQEAIKILLALEGFEIVFTAGNYEGVPFEERHSPRMMLFARKRG